VKQRTFHQLAGMAKEISMLISKAKRYLLKAIRILIEFQSKLSPLLPKIIEMDMKRLQGKGWGSGTVFEEATQAIGLIRKKASDEIVVLDIGANIGNYSKAVLKLSPNAKIFAFEPSSIARRDLETSFASEEQVEIFPFALGSSSGRAVLWSDKAGSGLGSLTKRRLDHFEIDFNVNEEIEISTLDEWNSSRRLRPDLIKIDVEGHELEVLKGGESILKDTKLVQFEFGGCNIDSRTYFQDFWYFFSSRGFSIYRISPHGPIPIAEYDEEDEHFMTTNYLAVRH